MFLPIYLLALNLKYKKNKKIIFFNFEHFELSGIRKKMYLFKIYIIDYIEKKRIN